MLRKVIKFVTPLSIEGLDMNNIASRYYAFNKKTTDVTPSCLKRLIVSVATDNFTFDNVTPIWITTITAANTRADFCYYA